MLSPFQENLADWRVVVRAVEAHMREHDVGLFHIFRSAQVRMDVCATSLFSSNTLGQLAALREPPIWVANSCRRMLHQEPANAQAPLSELIAIFVKFLLHGPAEPRVFDWDSMEPVDVLLHSLQGELDATDEGVRQYVSVCSNVPVRLESTFFAMRTGIPDEHRARTVLAQLPIVKKLRDKGIVVPVQCIEDL